jgi:hypothetical protein
LLLRTSLGHKYLTGVTLGSNNANIFSNTKASHSHDVNVTTPNAHSPPRIIIKRARFGRLIGGSPNSQSITKLRIVLDESASSNTKVPYNETSWAEVFHDTSWAEVFHDTSRI